MGFYIPKLAYYGSAIATICGVGYLTKDYIGGPKYEITEDMSNKVVVITGANTGLGKETAKVLAKQKAKVILACRDMQKCEETRKEIIFSSKNKYVYCRKCDLASQQSIRDFVKQFKKEHSKLHILINNAGVMRCPKSYTQEGIEMQLGVNHMGHFLLTNLLLDIIKESAPARIVNVASGAHWRGKINLKDLNSDKNYDSGDAYAQSKLANVLFTRELANRLKGTGVTVNAVHPGIVNTDIGRHMFVYKYFITRFILNSLTWFFIKTPVQGSRPILYAAVDPALNDTTGSYICDNTLQDVSEEAKNDKLAKWLWLVSEKWTQTNLNQSIAPLSK